jgi:hypothetical protein
MKIPIKFRRFFLKLGQLGNYPLRKDGATNFIFIHINKTGGTSIANAIGLPQKRHLTVREVINIVGYKDWNDAFKFTFVRNPWDKVVSHYRYRIKTNQNEMKKADLSFKEWVVKTYSENKDYHYYDYPKMFQPQVDWLKDETGLVRVDFIGRFENLHSDFEYVRSKIKTRKELPHLNKTKRDNYTKYYDEETKRIIREWFHDDIERFGYSFK